MHDRLFDNRKVENPIDKNEDLNRMSEEAWDGFLPRLAALQDIAERVGDSEDEASAALIWSEAFSFLMPLPETDQVEIVDEGSGRAVMQFRRLKSRCLLGLPVVLWQRIATRCQARQRTASSHSQSSTRTWYRNSPRANGLSAMKAKKQISGATWDTDGLECVFSTLRRTQPTWGGTSWTASFV